MALHILIFLSFLVISALAHEHNRINTVTYDRTSLIINGSRQLLFSGCIHYPRSPPEMWPDLIKKAKEGGLNTIQTYVFWNLHEPVQGEFDFEGNKDVVKFIKMIGDHGLYAVLRIGPYIEAEWNQGGFPYWLREVPGIVFRSDNEPFKHHMKKYAKKIVGLMKKEKLFYPQGGPIILSQIENEYNNVQLAYRENGLKYIQWAANMALNQKTGVPWIMCKQKDAPGEVINTCNGRHCGDTFTGPNGPNKPALWTENWTAQYRVFGDPPSLRTAEDIAYSVSRFFSKNGTLTTYYMYYGGTNFGRSSSSFVMTRYYDEAPLDEFGLKREPKFGHLRDLHRALRLSKKALLWGVPRVEIKNEGVEARYYEKPGTDICAAFLTNNHTKDNTTINFRGQEYFLPEKSISILPDCKTVVFNTRTIVAQHSKRKFVPSKEVNNLKWEKFVENIPTMKDLHLKSKDPLELYSLTKDSTDYAWYSTRVNLGQGDLPVRSDVLPHLEIANLGHAMVVFVNGEYAGFEHGSNVKKSFVFRKPIKLKTGENHISLLCMTVGFPNSGAYMEKRFAGPRAVAIRGLSSGTLDLTVNNWGHEVGLEGEKLEVFTKKGSKKVKWSPVQGPAPPTVTWYKTHFDAPEGDDPVALNMNSMGKGMAWVNGRSIGRYWVNYFSPLGQPSQAEYHIPRPFLKSEKNLLVVLEETVGNPEGIEVLLVNRDTICSFISEHHPPNVRSWKKTGGAMQTAGDDVKSGAHLTCPHNKVVKLVEFASFGNPSGQCGNFALGNCNSPNSKKIVEKECLGKKECTIPVERQTFDDKKNDQCPDISKTLAVQVRCAEKD